MPGADCNAPEVQASNDLVQDSTKRRRSLTFLELYPSAGTRAIGSETWGAFRMLSLLELVPHDQPGANGYFYGHDLFSFVGIVMNGEIAPVRAWCGFVFHSPRVATVHSWLGQGFEDHCCGNSKRNKDEFLNSSTWIWYPAKSKKCFCCDFSSCRWVCRVHDTAGSRSKLQLSLSGISFSACVSPRTLRVA